MPQVLRRRDISPPDFFRYVHSETGHPTVAVDWTTWQEEIVKHRQGNNLPPITANDAEDQLCGQLAPEWCEGNDPNRPWVDPRISLNDVADAMKVFASFMVSGFKFVSQEEATRRARICVGCPNNLNIQGCGACRQIASFVTGTLAQRSTPHDDKLKTCGVCRCVVKALVHIPLNALAAKSTPDREALLPSFCWQKPSGENYQPAAA